MTRATATLAILACFALPGRSAAQTAPAKAIFFDINVGAQTLSHAVDTTSTFPLFGETGSIATKQTFAPGPLVGVRIGYRVRERFALALAVSGFRKASEGQGVASVPSPILVASPILTTLQSSDLARREIGYHLQALWLVPVSHAFDVAVFAGPSVIRLQQALMTVTANGTQTVSGAVNQVAFAVGGNAGVEVVRPLSARFGVTVFTQYVFAKANLPSASGIKVGGLQSGGGLRIGF